MTCGGGLECAEVIFGAFRAPFMALLSEWEVTKQEDIRLNATRFAFRHKSAAKGDGMVMVSAACDLYRMERETRSLHFPIHIQHILADRGSIQVHREMPLSWGQAGSAIPDSPFNSGFVKLEVPEYYGFLKATPAGVKTPEGIIIDPSNIGEVLELVRKAQAPQQAAIRERARKGECPLEQTATILTLAE